jgi:glycosyltransferase involved in cell wall biosynthesis
MIDVPTFSVVIAAHDAARTIPATIRSVLAQTRQDFEIVVVDDGSVDDTEAALRRTTDDPRVRYLRQENRGPAAARNAGVEAARGPYVALLDSDDLWLPKYLESMAAAFAAEPEAALAYTDAWRLDEQRRRIFRKTTMSSQNPPIPPPRDTETLFRELLRRNFVYTSATVRRSTLAEVGGFTSLTRSEDYELWLRIAAKGNIFVRADGVLAVYRDRPGSRVHDPVKMLEGRREIYELVLRAYDLSPAERTLAAERLRATSEELAEAQQRRRPPVRRRAALSRFAHDFRYFRLTTPRDVARALPDLNEL